MIGAALEAYTWHSEAVLAAELAGDGTILRANPALVALTGADPAGTAFDALLTPPQRDAFRSRLRECTDRWSACTFAVATDAARPASDRRVWLRRAGDGLLLVAEPATGEQDRLVQKVLELNDDLVRTQRELVRERERLRRASETAEAASRRIARLEAITAAGLAHIGLDDVLTDLLEAIASGVDADRAGVLLLDPARRELVARAAVGLDSPVGDVRIPLGEGLAGTVAVSGEPGVDADGTTAAVPLVLDDAHVGVLQVVADPPRRLADDAVALLAAAAERAALAIARAQVHEREANIAETLQRALLPDSLPAVDGLRLTARFTPGSEVQVGGDWYDALPLPSGRLAVVIGDVAGKGLRAASLMGELRAALRAYALDEEEPQLVLGRLNRLATRSNHMATAVVAVADAATGAVAFASAGHLPPLHVTAGGGGTLLGGGRAAPLLAFRAPEEPGRAVLAPGDRLVLYTDGLVERREEPIDVGLDRLVAAAGSLPEDLDAAVDALVERMRPPQGVVRDDTAVIALERR